LPDLSHLRHRALITDKQNILPKKMALFWNKLSIIGHGLVTTLKAMLKAQDLASKINTFLHNTFMGFKLYLPPAVVPVPRYKNQQHGCDVIASST
jgi:hypothetical protein